VFEKLKKILGGGAAPLSSSSSSRLRTGGARRPARPRPAPGRSKDAGSPLEAPTLSPRLAPERVPTPREIPCPNCGEPMLADWGTTCGRCRPNLVAPKTLFLSPNQAATSSRAGQGLTLGWLVVISSLDERRPGTLIELDQDKSTLSRGDAPLPGQPGLFEFSDIYMSNGHAVVVRPRTSDRNDAFSIREREGAPTANGTFVNSRRVLPGESLGLADGDVIKVGATQLVFRALWLAGSDARAS
jgi:hypothetical protein